MEESILKSTKKVLGYELDDAFDDDILMGINTAISTLTDLGIGPQEGFHVEDDSAEWSDLIGEKDRTLNRAKTYVHLRVKMIFDPPGTSYHINAMTEQITELESRLLTHREVNAWVPTISRSQQDDRFAD